MRATIEMVPAYRTKNKVRYEAEDKTAVVTEMYLPKSIMSGGIPQRIVVEVVTSEERVTADSIPFGAPAKEAW